MFALLKGEESQRKVMLSKNTSDLSSDRYALASNNTGKGIEIMAMGVIKMDIEVVDICRGKSGVYHDKLYSTHCRRYRHNCETSY